MPQANTDDHLNQMTTVLQSIADNMATKDDLQDIRSTMATKDDLVLLEATVASKMDLKQVQISLQAKIRSNHAANIHHHLESRKAIGELNRAMSGL